MLSKHIVEIDPFNSQQTPTQVVECSGPLPLVLAIAGSMHVVKGKGLTAGAWNELIKTFENVAKMMRARGEQGSSLDTVLETRFDALAERKKEEVLKTAALAPGAVAPIELLRNVWEIQVCCGFPPTRWLDACKSLANHCLLGQQTGCVGCVKDCTSAVYVLFLFVLAWCSIFRTRRVRERKRMIS